MEKSDRRSISLAGLGLIGAGAVLGLALTTPAPAAPSSPAPATPQSQTAPAPDEEPT